MKQKSLARYLVQYLRPYWPILVPGLIFVLIFTAFWPVLSRLAGQLSADLGNSDFNGLVKVALMGCGVYICQGIAQYGLTTSMAKVSFAITLDIRNQVYEHLLRLGSDYFAKTSVGDLAYRLTEDVDRIGELIYSILHRFLPAFLQLIVMLGMMVYINWQLTIAVFILAPIIALLVGWFGEKLQTQSRKSQNQVAEISATITEDFSGIRTIQAFAAERYRVGQFAHKAEVNRQARYATEKAKAIQYPVISFLQVSSILFVFVLAGWQISNQQLTIPNFVSYLTSIALLIDPIAITTNAFNELKQSQASIDRVFELLAEPPLILEKPHAQELPSITGRVTYDNVTFAYRSDQPVLSNLDLAVKPGEMIALVGTSGAGKSTIVSLLSRFYDVQGGSISIDGVDIRDVTLASLRQQIGTVPQETMLFSGTVAQNIAFGQTDFDLAAVEAAAKIANAHQFISQLSQGYSTWVGERGTNFSGGQRQRIAIARAVFLNPRILVLDEATSALDSESEFLVQEALERIMVDRTVFIIAHRLATVRRAHRILVLEKGQLIESGTHDELLQMNGRYARFYAQQFRNSKDEEESLEVPMVASYGQGVDI
jgi:ATP-binding cassette, subfamily B, bacterial